MSDETKRRLTAVLAADVVGYSRLMGADEANTIATLRRWRADVFGPIVTEHHGDIIKNMGDGWLVVFDSAGDAVTCAVRVQEQLFDHEILKLRIGLHIGDIVHVGDDIYGDGVNIAARLQEVAAPNAIVISDITRRSIDGKLAADFSDLGQLILKNISDPVSAYGWNMSEVGNVPATHVLPAKPSIAVLPFSNMSGNPDQDYFSDGISEDLTTALSRFDWLFVIARNSAFTYKGQPIDVKRIGKELGIRYVLEGSTRRAGDRVRVNVQLTHAEEERHVWAQQYDRQMDDVFELQDDIVASIAATVAPEITLAEIERSRVKRPEALDAWDYYLRATSAYHKMTRDDVLAAIPLLEKAVEVEPQFVAALALLALCHTQVAGRGWVRPVSKGYKEAQRVARDAIRLAPSSPEANHAMSFVLVVTGDSSNAITHARRAINLNPNFSEAYVVLALALVFTGNIEGALEACHRAERSSPRDTRGTYLYDAMGHAYFMNGDYEKAIEVSKIGLTQDPSIYGTLVTLAAASAFLGRKAEAKKYVDELLVLVPRYTVGALQKNPMFIRPGDIDKLVEGMRLAGLPE